MARTDVRIGLCVTLACLWAGAPALAQTERGAIVGVVKDVSGGLLPGASVTVISADTSVSQTFTTNAQGVYEAPFLTPGEYRVRVAHGDFVTAEVERVDVNMGGRINVSVTLTPAGVATEVTVVGHTPLVQSASATIGQTLDHRTLVELPSGDHNPYQFLTLNSNVTAPAGGNAPAFRLESGGSFAISGTRPSSITFKIDGLANTDPGFGTPTITPSLESIHEFQVQNNAYSAEYEGIGQVNIATRTGTSRLRGNLFEYFRNEALQPTDPLLKRKTRLRFNQFGGTIGGPLWPSGGTFFFFSYEGRRHDTLSAAQAFVPTAAFRAGDFSAALGACVQVSGRTVPLVGPDGQPAGDCVRQGQIFDPATTRPNPAFNAALPVSALNPQFIRQPFADNRIPAARLNDSVRRAIEAQLPLPNFGDGLNNHTGVAGAVLNYDQYSIRADHTLSQADRIYARLAVQDNLRTNQPVIPYLTKHLQGKGRVFSATWARVIGSSTANEFRVGYVRGIYGDAIDEIDPLQFGIENTTLPTLPQFFLSTGNVSYGGFAASVITETQDTYQLADNFSLVRGRHSLKAGFQWSHNRFTNTERFGSNGTATFSGLYTIGNDGLTAAREHAIADFLLGLSQRTTLNVPRPSENINSPWAVYVQDDWKVNDRLTMSAGLRYEYHQPWKSGGLGGAAMDLAGEGRLLVVDPEVAARSDSPLVVCCASRRGVNADKNDFAPRVGVVFRPFDDPTWVRAGYGLYYSDMTQFFAWGSYTPLHGRLFQGTSGDFTRPGATVPNLFPPANFIEGRGVQPFIQSPVPADIHGPPVISVGGILAADNRTPYSHQWSVSVQRELLPRMLVDVTYQGSAAASCQRSGSSISPSRARFRRTSRAPIRQPIRSFAARTRAAPPRRS